MKDNLITGQGLATLNEDGSVPETRITDAEMCRQWVATLITSNSKRSETDASVKGLVDGNPPFKSIDLKKANQSYRSNANFRQAEAFVSVALSSFYDLFSESRSYAECTTYHGTVDEQRQWSGIITEEFDALNRDDCTLDYTMQLSQHDMVLYRMGPVMWEDEWDYRCTAVKCANLLVPDGTKSNLSEWESAVVLQDYQVHQLYKFIRNPEAAAKEGWDVKAVRQAIMNAAPENYTSGEYGRSWEKYQQMLRNNDFVFGAKMAIIKVAHVYYREFPDAENKEGAISHRIIVRDSTTPQRQQNAGDGWLFTKLKRYEDWDNVICPFYYDKGDGTHHGVKGMGIKFYSALELENRLMNHMVDAAFEMTRTMLQPTTADSMQKASIVPMGPYAILTPGMNVVQTNNQIARLDAPLAITREIMGTLTSNLQQYRQNQQNKEGNPVTAEEIKFRAEQMSVLGKTQLNRYYEQLDEFWEERFRRAANPAITKVNSGGEDALEFQKNCKDRGVPAAALKEENVCVKAARTIGQGSTYMRQGVLMELLQLAGMLPESGRLSVLQDFVAAKAGQHAVERYVPGTQEDHKPGQDDWEAMQENTGFSSGAPTIIVEHQNDVVHSQSHMQFVSQAAASLQQGGDPAKVLITLEAAGPHIAAHIGRMAQDPSRKPMVQALIAQWKQVAQIAEELKGQMQEQMKAQQEAAQKQLQAQAISSGTDPDTQIKAATAQQDMQLKAAKTQADIQRKAMKTQQDMALKDAKTAQTMRHSSMKAQQQAAQSKQPGA